MKKHKFKNNSGASYTLEERPKGGWKLTRDSSGAVESVSKNLLGKTLARLEAGEEIPFRGINYTVAIEQAILFLLIDKVHINPFTRKYTYRTRPKFP